MALWIYDYGYVIIILENSAPAESQDIMDVAISWCLLYSDSYSITKRFI